MKRYRRIAALVLALCLAVLALAGCSRGGGSTITVIETTPGPYSQEEYPSVGYFSPSSTPEAYQDEIIPAPVDVNDFSQSLTEPTPAPVVNDMTHGDFTYGVVVDTGVDIHPLRTQHKDMYSVNKLIFESLVELNEQLQPVPLLADRWSVEGNVWTFTLRSGIQFHNGQALTADDVVASYQEIQRNPDTHWYQLTQLISDMAAVDELTVQVTSKSAGYMLLYAMTFPVVESSTVASSCIGLDMPMGTGPYWYIQYDAPNALRLESNALWWKRPSGYIQSVVVLFYKTIRSALTGLELGEVDAIATDYPTAAISKNLTDRTTLDYSTQTYECIVPNLSGAILSDISVRQAIMYAIDRTTLASTAYAGMAQESEVPVIPGSYLYDAQATRYNYSPELALQILRDAGWSDPDQDGVLEKELGGATRRLSLKLFTYDRGTTATRSEAAELIAKQLRTVGFEIEVQVGTASAIQKRLSSGDFDLVLCGFELSEAPNLAFLLAGSGSCNYSRYNSSQMDTYLHDALSAATEAELIAAMSNVQMIVVEDLPILGLFFRSGVFISRTSVGGMSGTYQYDVLRGLANVIPTQ